MRLVAIDVGAHLRHVDLKLENTPASSGVCSARRDDLLRLLVQRLESQARAILDLQLEAADRAQALNRPAAGRSAMYASWICANFWFNDAAISFAERVFSTVSRSFEKSRQRDERDADVRRVDEAVDREARERHRVRDAGLRQHDVRHAADHLFGAVERRGLRQLRVRDEILLVLLRDEALGHAREAEPGQAPTERDVDGERAARRAQRLACERRRSARDEPLEEAIERPEHPAEREVDAALEAVAAARRAASAAPRRAPATASAS